MVNEFNYFIEWVSNINTYGINLIVYVEFAAVLLNFRNGTVEKEFHRFVRPSGFAQLPKRQQKQVAGAADLSKVLMDFMEFLVDICCYENVTLPHSAILQPNFDYMLLCSWSDMDLSLIMPDECDMKNIRIPNVMKCWVNAQKVFEVG